MTDTIDYSSILTKLIEEDESINVNNYGNKKIILCLYNLPINNWLDTKIINYNPKGILNIKVEGLLENYYIKSDTDLEKNDESSISILEFYKNISETIPRRLFKYDKALQIYSDKTKILIDPHTNRYYANLLFRILINYCIKNKIY